VINYLHTKSEDFDDDDDEDSAISKEERQYRKLLRLAVGELKISPTQGAYWSTDEKLIELLKYRPSIEDMKLILRPMSYLSKAERPPIYDSDKGVEHDIYRRALRKQITEYFLEQYSQKIE
jgi:hypothetical protein